MRRLCLYSDDSMQACGRKRSDTVIAGVAVEADKAGVRQSLLAAERTSGKGISDWYNTSQKARARYLEAVMDIATIHSCIFFRAFPDLHSRLLWASRAETIHMALGRFSPGRRCEHVVGHEGLNSGPRHNLRIELRGRGWGRLRVESARLGTDPEVRLSDALAGYIRGELLREPTIRSVLSNLPDTFVDLDVPQKENPPECSEGSKAEITDTGNPWDWLG